jgi:nicotinamidase-related amidase
VAGARDTIPLINQLLKSPAFALKVATQDFHPKDHVSFAPNHPGPNNKPFESFIDISNVVAKRPEETMKQRLWPVHCVQGTPGAELVDGLAVDQVDLFIRKGMDSRVEMYSAFADCFGNLTAGSGGVSDDLAKIMQDKDIKRAFVVGVAGDYCVKYTALDAAKAGFEAYLVEEAQRCADASGWESAKAELQEASVRVVSMNSREIQGLLSN